MQFTEDFIYTLKQNNPIESVASSYASLKKQSRGFVCLCPFHSEKTPSCHINAAEGYFHCFGCGAGGDVITFVMKAENLDYVEAVRFLADRAGMALPDDDKDTDFMRRKTVILEINRAAARYFNKILTKDKRGEKGRMYFSSRGLLPATIIKYGLGYADDDWHSLYDHLRSQGYADNDIVSANLCAVGRNGGIYDIFRDRVIFPIIDLRGNVIAFGGRIIDGSGPKYLNSSDTPVFKKSRNLFSLNFAKNSTEKRLILAEGYMDVIAVNQGGFENVVATLGTALTPEQARIMARYAEEVIISYDSDSAGQNAAHRAIELLSDAGLRTRILKVTGAKDPDEFIKKYGSKRFGQLLDNSDGAVSFELKRCTEGLDLDSDVGRVEYLKRCSLVLSQIRSPVERDVYISAVAKEQGISREALSAQVASALKVRGRAADSREWLNIRTFSSMRKTDPDSVRFRREYKAECGMISYIYRCPDKFEEIAARLPEDYFVTAFNRRVYHCIAENIRGSTNFDIMSLQSEFTADEMGRITAILEETGEIEIGADAAEDYIAILTAYHEESQKKIRPADMSDDDLRSFAIQMKNRK